MNLSNDLISQFAKITLDDKKTSQESTVYGTVVVSNDRTYVKLDGSDLLTPVITTAEVKDGERVTVMMKNHTAIVTGNISSPAARIGTVLESTGNGGKTATNYINFDENGLVIGNFTDEVLGNNVCIDSDSVDIRNGDAVYASYGADYISIGKNSNTTVIDLCNGSASMYRLADGAYGSRFLLESESELDMCSGKRFSAWSTKGNNNAIIYMDSVNAGNSSSPFVNIGTTGGTTASSNFNMYNDRILLSHSRNNTDVQINMEAQFNSIKLVANKIDCTAGIGHFAGLYSDGVSVSVSSHIHHKLTTSSEAAEVLLTQGSGDFYYLRPNVDLADTNYLGHPDHRWQTIYSVNALNTSSDIRLKENISKDMDKYVEMLDLLDPISYNWISEASNPKRKTHIGYGAQYVWKAIKDVGLEEKDFAGFCREISGNDSGAVYTYSLCLEEFIPILHAKIKKLENRILVLEKENQNGYFERFN